MSQARRKIEVEEVGDVAVITFLDKRILDEQNIQLIGDQLFALIDEDGHRKLLLDFKNVEYLSSAALGKLITLNKKIKMVSGQMCLCDIKAEIKEVFIITRLDQVFPIFDNQEAALQSFT